ncbi:TetR family transcriptional regulator [Xanthomonas citri pv. durantae]|uniref:TetR family transcriptional regulator n=1 Tax=Xanthomonas citri pv. durantae TaxID=487862 RepID=A0A9X6BKF6_XANCI|nr:TetR/AcrR family transcriptional regulator [Xanthomonas citri]QRD56556.1 TetR/AcrR family transcriptional regulator [Xanthomonas citri pv. citri]UVG57013.1 TetR family transcriptional regulator [Xanthomonas citri pv. durantae]CEH47434.1 Transcriptional regulator, TetR family [Xanthomonas citri pv. citri]CEH93877.1 Transcriptional regulator, TetR family [Xanthomonas citri pv. citri]
MRPSNRSKILEAAVRVVHRDGVTGITFEAVASEAGLTRGGMLYHFPSRDALLLGIHEYLAGQWEALLIQAAGKPADEASERERIAAYVTACTMGASSRVELQLMLEALTSPPMAAPWMDVIKRWLPDIPPAAPDRAVLWVIRLAADGLWVHESLSRQPLDPETRQGICRVLLDMIPLSRDSAEP